MAATMSRCRFAVLLLCLCWPLLAVASLPTQLDSDTVMLGDAVELRIDAGTLGDALDTRALQPDFIVRSQRQQRVSELRGGRFQSRVQHVLLIQPRRAGSLVVPALAVGSERSQPLRLQVTAPTGAVSTPSAQEAGGDQTWIVQADVGATTAWVGQPIGLQVSVLLGQDIAGGELIQEPPAGAGLQKVGQDEASRVLVNGQPYQRIVRRFLLMPEKDGTLVVPPARLRVRQLAGLWSGPGATVAVDGPALELAVRPIPADAGDDWLPLNDLRLAWTELPDRLVAGQGARFELEAVLEGATAAQRDVLVLPASGPGWRLYPEPPKVQERFEGARPVLHLHRSFLLVPEQAGALELPDISLAWWDAGTGQRKLARLAARSYTVQAGSTAAPAVATVDGAGIAAPTDPARPRAAGRGTWVMLPGVLVAMLAIALALWWWSTRRRQRRQQQARAATVDPPAGTRAAPPLQLVLAEGSVQEVIDELCVLGGIGDPAKLPGALDDPDQRQALADAERAWWAPGGDRVAARRRLREAFSGGPRWRQPTAPAPADPLPPLYPPPRP